MRLLELERIRPAALTSYGPIVLVQVVKVEGRKYTVKQAMREWEYDLTREKRGRIREKIQEFLFLLLFLSTFAAL